MHRILFSFAKKSMRAGLRAKTTMSKMNLWISLLFIVMAVSYLTLLVDSDRAPMEIEDRIPTPQILVINPPASFLSHLDVGDLHFWRADNFLFDTADAYYDFSFYLERLDNDEAGLILVFPKDFDAQLFDAATPLPDILTYYLPSSYATVQRDVFTYTILIDYAEYLCAQNDLAFAVNTPFEVRAEPLSPSDVDMMATTDVFLGQLIPLLLFLIVMYTAMQVGVQAFAGEKERGTLAAVLITPVKRSHMAVGTFLGVTVRVFLSTLIILIPLLIWSGFDFYRLLILSLLTLSLSAVIAGIVLVISMMSTTVLSAQAAFLPVFFLLIFVCMSAFQEPRPPSDVYLYLPFYGHYYNMASLFFAKPDVPTFVVLLVICLSLTVALLITLTTMLLSERFTQASDSERPSVARRRQKRELRAAKRAKKLEDGRIIFSYRPKNTHRLIRPILHQIYLPLVLLLIIQPLCLIVPAYLFTKSSQANAVLSGLRGLEGFQDLLSGLIGVLHVLMQTPAFLIYMGLGYILIIFFYSVIVRYVEKNSLATLGFASRPPKKIILAYTKGLLIGLALIGSVFLAMVGLGQVQISGFSLAVFAFGQFIIYGIFWIAQGASEEIMFRGYMLPRLSARTGRVVAVCISSIVFSMLHGANVGFSPLAFFNLFYISLFFSIWALYTEEIYSLCACHTMWNFAQGNLFGLHVSGIQPDASFFFLTQGKRATALLTGGTFGPEGGLIVTAVITLAFMVLLIGIRSKKRQSS